MANSDIKTIETTEPSTPAAAKPKAPAATKADKLLKLLKSKRGASMEQLQEASGWQAHSVRGFLSGTVKGRMGLAIESEADKSGIRRYRIAASAVAAEA